MSKLTVAVIGCGSISKHRHIPEYAAHPDVQLVAFCDISLPRAQSFADEYGGVAYADYRDMLREVNPQAVSVCTSNRLHAQVTLDAIAAGAHVLVEKPMATTDEDAVKMIEAAKARGVQLMVGHNQRFVSAHLSARKLITAGNLGKVLTFRTTFGHPGPDAWSVEGKNSWFFRKDDAVMGAMGDLGVHKVDLIRWLIDDEVSHVASFVGNLNNKVSTVDDNAVMILRMKSGVIGTIAASWTYYAAEDNSTIIWCENGTLKIGTDPIHQVIVEYKDQPAVRYEHGALATNTNQTASGVIDEFIASIQENRPPLVTGEEGRRSLAVILAAFESDESGRIVALPYTKH